MTDTGRAKVGERKKDENELVNVKENMICDPERYMQKSKDIF